MQEEYVERIRRETQTLRTLAEHSHDKKRLKGLADYIDSQLFTIGSVAAIDELKHKLTLCSFVKPKASKTAILGYLSSLAAAIGIIEWVGYTLLHDQDPHALIKMLGDGGREFRAFFIGSVLLAVSLIHIFWLADRDTK